MFNLAAGSARDDSTAPAPTERTSRRVGRRPDSGGSAGAVAGTYNPSPPCHELRSGDDPHGYVSTKSPPGPNWQIGTSNSMTLLLSIRDQRTQRGGLFGCC